MRQRGLALVEFALTATVLMAMVFGITEFGRAISQYDTLAKAARDAARYLSTQAAGDLEAIDAARCMAAHGNRTCSGKALAPGLTFSMVLVCDAVSCPDTHKSVPSAPVVNLVTVTIGAADNPYHFQSLFEYVLPSFDFAPISVTMRQ